MSTVSGFVEPRLREEFPGLRLDWTVVDARLRGSSREVERRLRELSNRYRGADVVAMRTQPIPHAYRAFFRQVGLDPDAARIPSEAAAVTRLLDGRFQSRAALADARLISNVSGTSSRRGSRPPARRSPSVPISRRHAGWRSRRCCSTRGATGSCGSPIETSASRAAACGTSGPGSGWSGC